MIRAYRALVEERDSPWVRKVPSRSFVTVLRKLDELPEHERYARGIAKHSWVDQTTATRVLRRMYRLELVDRWIEPGDEHQLGRPKRTYYTLTADGRELAKQLAPLDDADHVGGVS